MQFLTMITPIYILAGFVAGAVVGMTGVGGGSLMTPLLILGFGVHPATAVGTDLIYAAVTNIGGATVHGTKKTVDWRIVCRLAAGSIPASLLTLLLLGHFRLVYGSVDRLITIVLASTLLLTALSLLFHTHIRAFHHTQIANLPTGTTHRLTTFLGILIGILVSTSSVGAGAIAVTGLILLYPGLPAARIAGTDIAHAVPLTLIAGLGHWTVGSVDWTLLLSLLCGSLPGILIGSLASVRIPDKVLRYALAVMLIVIGTRLSI